MSTPYHTLLELEIEEPDAGAVPQRMGFTTTPAALHIDPGDGSPLRTFGPGLITASLPGRSSDFYAGGSAAEGSAQIQLALDAFDAVTLFAQGIRLQRIRARLWWWRRGWTLADAVQVWRGRVTAPEIDPDRGVFSCTLAPGTREIDVAFPPGLIGDEGRFPDAPEASRRVALPVIYGQPTNVPIYAITDDSIGASPPAAPGSVRYIIAGHMLPTQVVRAASDSGMVTALLAPQYGTDGLGQRYTYISVPNSTAGWSPGAALYVQSVIGMPAPGFEVGSTAARYIDKLGDVLLHLVETYSRERFGELDRDRIYTARTQLNRYTVGAWFNEAGGGQPLLQILKSRFETQFPVSFNFAGGLWGWDYTGVPDGGAALGHIVWGQNAHDRSSLQPVPIDLIRSRFHVTYLADGYAGGATASVLRGPYTSALCKSARDRWGTEAEAVVSAPDVSDGDSARLLAEDLILRLTTRRARISYVVDEPKWVTLPLFGRLYVTDDTWGWSREPFLLEGVSPVEPGRVALSLITERGI